MFLFSLERRTKFVNKCLKYIEFTISSYLSNFQGVSSKGKERDRKRFCQNENDKMVCDFNFRYGNFCELRKKYSLFSVLKYD